jgi:hypothetical protein
MAQGLAEALPGRGIHVTADSAYAGEELKKLGKQVTWTTRLRKDAALHSLAPQRTGKRGRPRLRGDRLPNLAALAATAAFAQVTVTRYGKTGTVRATADMTAKLRRVLIAARFKLSRPDHPTPEEIRAIRLAGETLPA